MALSMVYVRSSSPAHDVKRPDKYFFSIKFFLSLSINSCHHSNGRGCSDIEGLGNRINQIPWNSVLVTR